MSAAPRGAQVFASQGAEASRLLRRSRCLRLRRLHLLLALQRADRNGCFALAPVLERDASDEVAGYVVCLDQLRQRLAARWLGYR